MTTPAWLDSRITVGNIITIAVIIGGLVGGWFRFDYRLALVEDKFTRQVVSDEAARGRVERRLERIEADREDVRGRVIRIEEQLKAQDQKLDIILRTVRQNPHR